MDKNVTLRGRNDYTVRCQDCGWEYNGIKWGGFSDVLTDKESITDE